MKSTTAPTVVYIEPKTNEGNRHFGTPHTHLPNGTVRFIPKRFSVTSFTDNRNSQQLPAWSISTDYFLLPLVSEIGANEIASIAEQEGFDLNADEIRSAQLALRYIWLTNQWEAAGSPMPIPDEDERLKISEELRKSAGDFVGYSIYRG